MFIFSRENTGILAKWWRNVDKEVLFLFIFLFFLGLFFSFSSTSSVVAEKFNKETYFFFLKHFIFVLISLFLLFFISIQNKERIIKSLPILFSISILLLLLVPIIGVEIKGSKRWIDLIYLPRFQPIEFVKPLFILLAAKVIVSNEKINIYKRYILSFFILFVITILLINQPDLGQTLLLITTWLTMVFVSGFNMIILTFLSLIVLITLIVLIYFFPSKFGYVFLRIQTFLNPEKDPLGVAYQVIQSKTAIGSGGLIGKGWGEGTQTHLKFLPVQESDFILSVIGPGTSALKSFIPPTPKRGKIATLKTIIPIPPSQCNSCR